MRDKVAVDLGNEIIRDFEIWCDTCNQDTCSQTKNLCIHPKYLIKEKNINSPGGWKSNFGAQGDAGGIE